MYTVDQAKLQSKSYSNISDIANKRVIVRSCLNVTIDPNGAMVDSTRFDESLPLIKELATSAKSVVIMGHLGRPKERSQDSSFWNIAESFNKELESLGITVKLIENLDETSKLEIQQNNASQSKTVYLLENIRYFAGEESKDAGERENFAKELASLADVFINDAFADYRESASTYDIAKFLPSFVGPVFLKEVSSIAKFSNPNRPFVAILGGAKLSEKLDALNALGEIADKILVGGAMAYTLLKAKGISTGKSLIEEDKLEIAKEIISKYGNKLVLPIDHLISKEFSEAAPYEFITQQNIPEDSLAIDIGWETIKLFKNEIANAKSILWNGPMGVFEWDHSGVGTQEVGNTIVTNAAAFKFAGGGDSIAAINKYMLKGFDHISTGGGAMLSYISYDAFPTLDIILNN